MIFYNGKYYHNGEEYKKIEGELWLKAGDIVSMTVNVPTCTVTWTRNGEVKAQQQFKQLQGASIKWVPYIYLYSEDSVNLLKESFT